MPRWACYWEVRHQSTGPQQLVYMCGPKRKRAAANTHPALGTAPHPSCTRCSARCPRDSLQAEDCAPDRPHAGPCSQRTRVHGYSMTALAGSSVLSLTGHLHTLNGPAPGGQHGPWPPPAAPLTASAVDTTPAQHSPDLRTAPICQSSSRAGTRNIPRGTPPPAPLCCAATAHSHNSDGSAGSHRVAASH